MESAVKENKIQSVIQNERLSLALEEIEKLRIKENVRILLSLHL